MKDRWPKRRLDDIVTRLTNGYVGPTRNIYVEAGVPYLLARHVRSNELAFDGKTFITAEFNEKHKKSKLKTGDVLLVQSGHIGHSAVVSKEHEGHNCHAMIVITPVPREVSGDFLSLFFNTPVMQEKFEEIRSGSTVPHLTCREVRELEIPVPPLAEQQRIVGILHEGFEVIATAEANAEKNLQNARALFESHLQSVFTQRGEGWVDTRLADICDRVSVGHVGPTSEFYCDPSDGIPFLRSQNVRPGKLDWDGVQYITKEFHGRLRKSQIRFGDLLFVRVGANRGDCCAVLEDVAELNCANIVFARPTRGNAAFLERYCQSPPGRAQLLGMTTGSAQGVINTSSVAELVVPLPKELDQEKIVIKIDELHEETQRLATIYERKLAALDDLKKSLLHQAFSGEL